jgi:hypothetical protein
VAAELGSSAGSTGGALGAAGAESPSFEAGGGAANGTDAAGTDATSGAEVSGGGPETIAGAGTCDRSGESSAS